MKIEINSDIKLNNIKVKIKFKRDKISGKLICVNKKEYEQNKGIIS